MMGGGMVRAFEFDGETHYSDNCWCNGGAQPKPNAAYELEQRERHWNHSEAAGARQILDSLIDGVMTPDEKELLAVAESALRRLVNSLEIPQ